MSAPLDKILENDDSRIKRKVMMWKDGGGVVGESVAELCTPCPCGCDYRDTPDLKGYIMIRPGGNRKGGYTLKIFSQKVMDALKDEFKREEGRNGTL